MIQLIRKMQLSRNIKINRKKKIIVFIKILDILSIILPWDGDVKSAA